MSEDLSASLYEDDDLQITIRVDDEVARLDLASKPGTYDLGARDDVVVVINGRSVPVEARDPGHAVALLGNVGSLSTVQLMVRIHEFFEGWELDLGYSPEGGE